MGTRTRPPAFMEWQATLEGMLKHGAIVARRCVPCETWEIVPALDLAADYGLEASLIDFHPPCERCSGPVNFHASPGEGTPFRPLLS